MNGNAESLPFLQNETTILEPADLRRPFARGFTGLMIAPMI
jgi:hypothetical protein